MGRDGAKNGRVAVRIGFGGTLSANHAASSGHVFNHDRLAKNLAHPFGHHPAEHVDRAAGRRGHNHADRPLRPLLGGNGR